MTKIAKPTTTLTEQGFVPGASPRTGRIRKVAGVVQDWRHADGRSARVSYGLYSRTGQRSMGAAAMWGFFVEFAA